MRLRTTHRAVQRGPAAQGFVLKGANKRGRVIAAVVVLVGALVAWGQLRDVGAFAIHGYHSVPSYPASHGCVRIPIWVAPRVYSLIDYGTTVYVY